ncbi:hypothetical protein OG789_11835 [Streptomyces jietaisiensis]|uniref:Uncharacterized protein n=1 Tax=Streptomyces griseoaurantiacus TaxID=68213 RepID=A0ABZ1V4E7_9ACTN|nr:MULTISPECIES: hypothetical protein [Streptomyces]MDX3088178.1 hypothetical protein [Streptomyces sp. ME12-02E]MDX3331534.1 hypothetical protein [Streptomyces sp. ME02-6978a]
MDASAGFVRDLIGSILYQLEKLTIAIPALRDPALAIGVLGHETRVHGIGLQDTGGLFENGGDHR